MSILDRFTDIISANVNALLDKMEDPSKMIDQYLRDVSENLAEVKKETAGVMAQAKQAKNKLDQNTADINKYVELAKKAILAGNDNDARIFLAKKQELEEERVNLEKVAQATEENAQRMIEMHNKLTKDIEELKRRKQMIQAKTAVAKTQERLNKVDTSMTKTGGVLSKFDRMEEKADRMFEEAKAMAELNKLPLDEALELEKKYSGVSDQKVEDELASLKSNLGL
ncbi:MAG: PspA/IM30 family protein [Desulfitobacterium sp.]|nr:PspA/IM30 family protein [Desulfitobacterium sp.]